MAETQYTSTLTGPELDEALRDAAGVDAKVEQAQSAAQQAAQSASSAQGYASAASGSASQASTSAGLPRYDRRSGRSISNSSFKFSVSI